MKSVSTTKEGNPDEAAEISASPNGSITGAILPARRLRTHDGRDVTARTAKITAADLNAVSCAFQPASSATRYATTPTTSANVKPPQTGDFPCPN